MYTLKACLAIFLAVSLGNQKRGAWAQCHTVTSVVPAAYATVTANIASSSEPQTFSTAFTQAQPTTTAASSSTVSTSSSIGATPPASPSSSSSSSSLVPSKEEFDSAVTQNGFSQPTDAQYTAFAKGVDSATFSSKREVAMFLGEILHESMGLTKTLEVGCENNSCTQYNDTPGVDVPGKTYCGRGYIQLTHAYNYKTASEAMFSDDRLVSDPDPVATDQDLAWGVSFWFWRANVHGNSGVQAGQFGSATMVINGGLECNGSGGNQQAQTRFKYYTVVLKAFGIDETPNPAGC